MSDSAGTAALSARVSELEKSLASLRAAEGSGRLARTLLLLVVLGIVGVIGWWLYGLYGKVNSKPFQDGLMAEGTVQLEKLKGTAEKSLRQAMERSGPKVGETFKSEFMSRTPDFTAAFEKEREPFVADLKKLVEEKSKKLSTELADDFTAIIREEYKELTKDDTDRMRNNFLLAADRIAQEHYLKPASDALDRISKTWESFPAAAAPKAGEMPLEQQLIGHLAEIAKQIIVMNDKAAVSNEKLADPTVPGKK